MRNELKERKERKKEGGKGADNPLFSSVKKSHRTGSVRFGSVVLLRLDSFVGSWTVD